MYRLQIATVELAFVEELDTRIRLEDLSMSLVERATDGSQAMQMMEQSPPDILITDLYLPHRSGLQLLQWIIDHQLPTLCIIIVGMDELSEAQQALRLGAYGIISKPYQLEEVREVLHHVKQHLDQKQYNIHELSKLQRSLIERQLLAKEQEMYQWLLHPTSNQENRHEKINGLSLRITPKSLEVGMMRFVIEAIATKRYEDADMGLIRFAATNILQETLAPHFQGFIEVVTTDTDMIWIANSLKNKDAELMTQLRLVAHHIERFLGLAVIMVSGPTVTHIDQLHVAYERTINRIENLHFKGIGGCYLERGALPNLETMIGAQNRIDELNPIEEGICHDLTAYAYSPAIDQLELWLDKLRNSRHLGKVEIQQRAITFANKLQMMCRGESQLTIVWQSVELTCVEQLSKADSFDELASMMRMLIRSWVEQYASQVSMHLTVKETLATIQERYFTQLTGESLAKERLIPLATLNQLFKQEVGMTIVDYVQHYRIERAQPLLLEADAKVDVVARQVGYTDERNFKYTFKKWIGLTPVQYQNMK